MRADVLFHWLRPGHDDWADQSIGRASHQQTSLFMNEPPLSCAGTYVFLVSYVATLAFWARYGKNSEVRPLSFHTKIRCYGGVFWVLAVYLSGFFWWWFRDHRHHETIYRELLHSQHLSTCLLREAPQILNYLYACNPIWSWNYDVRIDMRQALFSMPVWNHRIHDSSAYVNTNTHKSV